MFDMSLTISGDSSLLKARIQYSVNGAFKIYRIKHIHIHKLNGVNSSKSNLKLGQILFRIWNMN